MRVERLASVQEFQAVAGPFLTAHEAANCAVFGDCDDALRGAAGGVAPYLAVVREGDNVVAAGVCTLPQRPVFVACDPDNVDGPVAALAKDVVGFCRETGRASIKVAARDTALGPLLESVREQCKGVQEKRVMEQLIYQISAATLALPPVPEHTVVRQAEVATDLQTMRKWHAQFQQDVGLGVALPPNEFYADICANACAFFLCNDKGERLATAMTRGHTPNGVRVSLVYTPPEHRKHGFASYLVAWVCSQWLHRRGKQFVFLFADAGNPTTNRIYQAVGFRLVTAFGLFELSNLAGGQ